MVFSGGVAGVGRLLANIVGYANARLRRLWPQLEATKIIGASLFEHPRGGKLGAHAIFPRLHTTEDRPVLKPFDVWRVFGRI